MSKQTLQMHRFQDKPQLLNIVSALPRPEHIGQDDWEAILFYAPSFGKIPLSSGWWADEPTPDLFFGNRQPCLQTDCVFSLGLSKLFESGISCDALGPAGTAAGVA